MHEAAGEDIHGAIHMGLASVRVEGEDTGGVAEQQAVERPEHRAIGFRHGEVHRALEHERAGAGQLESAR
jgi:hypothetical protein